MVQNLDIYWEYIVFKVKYEKKNFEIPKTYQKECANKN